MYEDLVHECSVTYDAATEAYVAIHNSRVAKVFSDTRDATEALNGIEVNELQLKVFEVNPNGLSRKEFIWCLMNNKLGWRPRVDRSYIYE